VYIGVVNGNDLAMTIGGQSKLAGTIATEYAFASHAGSHTASFSMASAPTDSAFGVQATFKP
jgi:hypothetical protein